MTRFIVIALLILVFFFGGVTYGTLQTDSPLSEPEKVQTTYADTISIEEELGIEGKEHFINKTASFFEKIFSTCYEIIIQALYKIANSFFD